MARQLLFFLLGSYLTLSVAQEACTSFVWSEDALRNYCNKPGPAYRSPACSLQRLCTSASFTTPRPGPQVCATDRLFITLCRDQPGLDECKSFSSKFSTEASLQACYTGRGFPTWSTAAAEEFMTSCSQDMAMDGCQDCNATACATPDPLLAYSRACKDMLMDGCQPWTAFCAQETPAAAQAVCVPRSQWVLPDDARCLADPTQPECASYTYPDNSTRADMDRLCRSMPDMPGCSIRRECEKTPSRVAPRYCRPFVLLATLCTDMGGMKGCEGYKALCATPGSVVAQCKEQPPIPGAPTWREARTAVFEACGDHPMAGCSACSRTSCPDPLGSLAAICHEMPEMAVCGRFWAFCNRAGADDVAPWCADDSAYLPSMLMYFHQRTQELLLWKEWRPMTQGQYAASVVVIVAMGVVATGLKTLKGVLALRWAHQRSLLGAPQPVTSVWLPQRGHGWEIAVKGAITGVSLTLDYFNMLIAMTFNVGFFCAVIGGYLLGTLLFGHVVDNYGQILHQRRRELAALARLRNCAGVNAVNGGSQLSARLLDSSLAAGGGVTGVTAGAVGGYVPPKLVGDEAVVAVVLDGPEGAGRGGGGVVGQGMSGLGAGEEDSESEEDTLRVVVESEGDCHCVHSA